MRDPSLVRFRRVVQAACDELERRRQEVNDLNVFPVPDGDTGDNMAMTMRAVLEELDALGEGSLEEIGRDRIVEAVARAALLGARGNSGVILSQIVRGAAEELASRPGELVDPVLVAAAFARAADAAYRSVREPAEGTMLTAVRAMAHRVAQDLAHMDQARLRQGAPPEEQDALLADVLSRALEAASEAVERGPEQLRPLREAGVVDAGAYGLTVIMAGVLAALRGAEVELAHQEVAHGLRALHYDAQESSRYRYCTNFAITGQELDSNDFVPRLEQIGDSVLVVGDANTLRVHLHTDDPQLAVAVFAGAGDVSRLDVADMREQVAQRDARLGAVVMEASSSGRCGVVAVATGDGLVSMYRGERAVVVDPGAKMNPSTYELLAAIHSVDADEVVVLPNSANVVMAAERAAELSERNARVVATRSPQEGLAAIVAFDPSASAEENAESLWGAVSALATGGVAPAARDDVLGRFRTGDAVGYIADELVAWGTPDEVLRATIALLADGRELVTCIAGAEAPLGEDEVEQALPAGLELDFHEGGQPAWWYLLAVE
ncbi:MAG TPA: DAK2 domain-containing protein [Thermoleophilaceae bacterium]|jgi:DAK2 domain fusion protein YloV|nr:DAK2 domain-containing protein [Thermoleophilaceae bacterium]